MLSSLAWSAIRSSNANNNDLAYFRTKEIKISMKESQKLVVDGEIIDIDSDFFEVNPGALQVVAPIPLTT